MRTETPSSHRRLAAAAGFAALAALAAACASGSHRAAPAQQAATPAPAAEQAAAPAQPAAAAPAEAPAAPQATWAEVKHGKKLHHLYASLASVNLSADDIVVSLKSGKTETFKVLSDTRFDRGGSDHKIAFADLKAGERVRVTYVGDDAGDVHVLVQAAKHTLVASAKSKH